MTSSSFKYRILGIPKIDLEHFRIISLMGELIDLCDIGDKEVIDKRLRDLKFFLLSHFSTEEEWMKSVAFPHIEEHKREHKRLIETLETIIQNFEFYRRDRFAFLERVMIGHVEESDYKYVPYAHTV